jgi:Cd2+/Zn2+-exporting ATPase
VALVLAAFGFVNLWIAVAADMGTSLAVTLNGMRLALRRRNRVSGAKRVLQDRGGVT